MNILIPQPIYQNAASITKLECEITYAQNKVTTISFSDDFLNAIKTDGLKSITILPSILTDYIKITLNTYLDTGILHKYNIVTDVVTKDTTVATNGFLRINTNCKFPDTLIGKFDCLSMVAEDIKNMQFDPMVLFHTKSLIYYTIFGDDYVKLLDESLKTILIKTPIINFDILVIADIKTQEKINLLDSFKKFNTFFLTVPACVDGVEASMNKLKIFDFEFINNYRKVIFLDADIIALKDMNILFDKVMDANKLYVINSPLVGKTSFRGPYHGLLFNVDYFCHLAELQNSLPFNAGQFAFINSSTMNTHFKNIRNFSVNWPSMYFFEQSFMNVYGILVNFLDYTISDLCCLANATEAPTKLRHSLDDVIIHFTAPCLDGKAKLKFLTDYVDAHCI
jgi:hypothetical protein